MSSNSEAQFEFFCPGCEKPLYVPDKARDLEGLCPYCYEIFRIPSQNASVIRQRQQFLSSLQRLRDMRDHQEKVTAGLFLQPPDFSPTGKMKELVPYIICVIILGFFSISIARELLAEGLLQNRAGLATPVAIGMGTVLMLMLMGWYPALRRRVIQLYEDNCRKVEQMRATLAELYSNLISDFPDMIAEHFERTEDALNDSLYTVIDELEDDCPRPASVISPDWLHNCGQCKEQINGATWACPACLHVLCKSCMSSPASRQGGAKVTEQQIAGIEGLGTVRIFDLTGDDGKPTCPRCGGVLRQWQGHQAGQWSLESAIEALSGMVDDSQPDVTWGLYAQQQRIEKIGEAINRSFSFKGMQFVWHGLKAERGPGPAAELTRIWDGIGSWRS